MLLNEQLKISPEQLLLLEVTKAGQQDKAKCLQARIGITGLVMLFAIIVIMDISLLMFEGKFIFCLFIFIYVVFTLKPS